MERETQIIQNLFMPVLQKDERFDASKCNTAFWEKITNEFIDFEIDKKPFYAAVYRLEFSEVEQVINA